ncbi:MAG: hypothetical protein F4X63_00315 [Nitrospira sp. SB0662_bin_26]|nr:hypothetical protein [Nitrospira sp. SB0662_bin_26]
MDDSEPSTPPPAPDKDETKAKKEIHVVSVPHDDDMIAQEMAELFEEDEVTHQHGSTEPEGD